MIADRITKALQDADEERTNVVVSCAVVLSNNLKDAYRGRDYAQGKVSAVHLVLQDNHDLRVAVASKLREIRA